MRNQRINPHHHQEKDIKGAPKPRTALTPEAELITLVAARGEVLVEHTLRTIKEPLELQGAGVRRSFCHPIKSPPSAVCGDYVGQLTILQPPAELTCLCWEPERWM
jgi:hypothetical protein